MQASEEANKPTVSQMQGLELQPVGDVSTKGTTDESVETKNEQKIPMKIEENGNHSSQMLVKRQFSRHLRIHGKTGSHNKMVQTFITGNFFVNTSNVYTGDLVE